MVYFAIISKNDLFLYIALTLNGFSNMGVMSTCFELAVEQTYPIGEATSCGFINVIANTLTFILVLILTPILEKKNEIDVLIGMIIILALPLFSLIFSALSKVEYKRLQYNQSFT